MSDADHDPAPRATRNKTSSPDPSLAALKPRSMTAVLTALKAALPGLPDQQAKGARYLLTHPREAGVRSMRGLASDAGVHPNTFVRLAKQIGFDGFEEMRERFRDFLRSGPGAHQDRARRLGELAASRGGAGVATEIAQATLANLEQMYDNADLDALQRAARLLVAARRSYVIGVGAVFPLAYSLWYLARMSSADLELAARQGVSPIDALAWIGPEDALVAITFQPYRVETLAAAEAARAAGAQVVALTDSPGSPLADSADVLLAAPTHTPQFFPSNVAATALIEGLVALMAAECGEAAAERLARFHQRRWEDGVYLLEPIGESASETD